MTVSNGVGLNGRRTAKAQVRRYASTGGMVKKSDKHEGVVGAGSAAIRKAMSRSFRLGGSKPSSATEVGHGDLADALADDPVNQAIESEIVPRLMMVHSGALSALDQTDQRSSDSAQFEIQVTDFASLPLEVEAGDLLVHIDSYIKQGMEFDTICVEVLAPAARALGRMWEDDECDFVDVTMGLWRLQEVMRALSAKTPKKMPANVIPGTALFSPIPGDPHAFGAQMIEEIFAKAGWLSEVSVKPSRRELLDRISRKPFDLIGLTITRDCPMSSIASLVKTIRNVSVNPHISIMIGGKMVIDNSGLVDEVEADGTAHDAIEALKLAEVLLEASRHKALAVR